MGRDRHSRKSTRPGHSRKGDVLCRTRMAMLALQNQQQRSVGQLGQSVGGMSRRAGKKEGGNELGLTSELASPRQRQILTFEERSRRRTQYRCTLVWG